MKRIKPIATVLVVGAALLSCAKTQTCPSEPAATSRKPDVTTAETPPSESSAEGASKAEPHPAVARAMASVRVTCPLDIKRQINCVDEYIPMIVGVRIKLDFPPGMAAKGRDEAGREKLEAAARQEFPEYYSVEQIPTICAKREAMVEKMPPHMLEELSAIGSDCLAEKDCAGFSRCVAPVVEQILAMQANAGGR